MKRILTLMIVLVMFVSVFAGCTKDTTDETAKPAQEPKTTETKTEETGLVISEKGVFPIVNETVTLKIFTPQMSANVTDYDDNKFTQYMEEKTNVNIEWMFAPEKEAKQKINLLLASNTDLPDSFMGQNIGLRDLVVTYGEQEIFVPINEYLETQSAYLAPVLEKEPRALALATAPDGNIYFLPKLNAGFPNQVSKRLFINQVWLDKLKLDTPTTTDEFRDVLIAFRDNDPNGNGQKDEIPFIGATTGWNTGVDGFILNAFIQYWDSTPYCLDNGTVVAEYDTEAYRDGLRYLNDLVKEGLIDSATFTQDKAQLKQLFENESAALIGAIPGGGPNTFANMNGERRREYEALAPLAGPNGVQNAGYNPDNIISGEAVITSACEYPEVAFKFYDLMYEQETSIFSRYGEPGVDWKEAEPGTLNVTGGEAVFEGILPWGPAQNSHWQNRNPAYDWFVGLEVRSEDPYELQRYLAEAAELYRPYIPTLEQIVPKYLYEVEDNKEISEINAVLNDFVKDYRVKFITGALDIEKDWDSYLKELENIGYNRVMEIMQNRIDGVQ